MIERDDTSAKKPDDDAGSLRRIRLFSLIQFVVSAAMALLLVTGRILMPSEAVTVLAAAWAVVVLPSYIAGGALMLYCARKTRREVGSWSGELAFWSVMPVGAFVMLWVF